MHFWMAQEEDDKLWRIRKMEVALVEEETIWPGMDRDASETAVGMVLCQEQGGMEYPITYASQKLNDVETRNRHHLIEVDQQMWCDKRGAGVQDS
ncbi:hypothetical protein Y1Q_0013310 [Alligator mississippiensis]|uniref:Reverse transcriptase/retrotransposon-derived protein RNase H-like domain-containing protein n=1 Tax=Alligator mississippiensis TaxID=8496 RepID=A0A151NTQ0_ALLMI|nr:hypothetical protein Y1Q_0013310 [Alligator mississippiensis]